MIKMRYFFYVMFLSLISSNLFSNDWPIYKGNIYFTGNNDEITVKNNNLKWLYQAEDIVFNPIVSDGRIYFTDLKKNVYCLAEETGKLVWKFNLRKVSEQFQAYSKAIKGLKAFLKYM